MDFPSTKSVHEQSDSTDPQESSRAAPSAATFERQLSEIGSSGGVGGAMPAASAPQPAQSTGIAIRYDKRRLHSEDAPIILGLEGALIMSGFTIPVAKQYVSALLNFSRWLFEKNRPSILARLDNQSLTDGGDVLEFTRKGNPKRLLAAIDHLRTFRSTGGVPISRRAKLNPHPQNVAPINPEDAVLMEPRRVDAAAAQHRASQETGSRPEELPAEGRDQDLLLGLMDEPRSSSSLEPAARHDQAPDPGKSDRQQSPDEPMAALARSNLLPSEEVLINDEHATAELRPAKRQRTLNNPQGVTSERQLSEIANSGGRPPTPAPAHQQGASSCETQPMLLRSGYEDVTAPHAVATYVGDAAAQHSAPQRAVSRPLVLPEGYDQDLRLMVEDGPSWPEIPPEQAQDIVQAGWQEPAWPTLEASPTHSTRARSDAYGGLEVSFNPNSPASFELRDIAWSPAPDFPSSFAGPGARQLGSPQGLSPMPASSDDEALAWLSEELARRQMQEPASPSTARAQDLYRGFEALVDPDPAELDDNAHFAPAPSARTRSDIYRGLPLVDLTAPAPSPLRDDLVRPFPITSSEAQIGALNPIALVHSRGQVLGDEQWLGDEHILRDYQLQEQDLQRNDPDLAVRTRFVNPLIALNYLRSNDDGVVQTGFQRIVYDDNGNDTADFLFLPVINANPEDPNSLGNHWSLLFVDRSERGRPVAYHYDSYGGLNNRDAEHLARRLNLPLQPAGMAQQQNTYDCGVFVVDGTRELVRQLAQGWEPDQLNLSNVVANRQALQNRLRG
ncbi:Ulp1 family isopeptidase [Bradyrhizobium elkanii]